MRLKGFSFILIILLLGWVVFLPAPVSATDCLQVTNCPSNSVVAQYVFIDSPTDADVEVLSYESGATKIWKKYVENMTVPYNGGFCTYERVEGYADEYGEFFIQLLSANFNANVTASGTCDAVKNTHSTMLYFMGATFGVLFIIFLMKVMT